MSVPGATAVSQGRGVAWPLGQCAESAGPGLPVLAYSWAATPPAQASSLGWAPAPRHGFGVNARPPLTPTIPNAGVTGKRSPHWGNEMS